MSYLKNELQQAKKLGVDVEIYFTTGYVNVGWLHTDTIKGIDEIELSDKFIDYLEDESLAQNVDYGFIDFETYNQTILINTDSVLPDDVDTYIIVIRNKNREEVEQFLI